MEFSRKSYLQKLVRADGNGMIKIVTGISRCGKSYLLFEIFLKWIDDEGVEIVSMEDFLLKSDIFE